MAYQKINAIEAEEREQILFGGHYDPQKYYGGGCRSFDNLSVEDAKELIRLGFVDPEDTQNLSPTMQEFVDFCDDGTGVWMLHGYAVSPERDDCRVTFEGVESSSPITAEQAVEFIMSFRFADDLYADAGGCAYCWYD